MKLKRPIGLHVVEGNNHAVFVQSVKPDLSAAKSKRIEVSALVRPLSLPYHPRFSRHNNDPDNLTISS